MNSKNWRSGLITEVPHESFAGSFIILLTTGWISLVLVLFEQYGIISLLVLSILLLAATAYNAAFAIHITLISLLLILTTNLGNVYRLWPFNILFPLMAYAFVVLLLPKLRESIHWCKKGKFDSKIITLVIGTIILSGLALFAWVELTNPDISRHLDLMPKIPFWAYPFAGISFAFINATMEEIIFRGIVMEALDSTVGSGYRSVTIQSLPFAAYHYLAGFPNGAWGFFMVFLYGIMLGSIRRLSQGMLAPIVAHAGADITIFSIVLIYYMNR